MLEFKNVTKTYPNGRTGLKQLSVKLAKGELAFLTGHSGAGKSTLLKLAAMIEPVSSGEIIIDQHSIKDLKRNEVCALRQQMGIIFQNPRLLPDHNVFDNVALPLEISGMRASEIGKRTRAALDKVGLLGKEKSAPHQLSLGEQQRIGIARAVVHKPKILLADEPTGNLDPQLSREIMSLFIEFNRVGVSILIASHDLALISGLQHRIIVLQKGFLASPDLRLSDHA